MRFSVFTASTPEWTPRQAARTLAEQGWDGVEWRITDQREAPEPGFWAGNRSTWPFTGLEERLDEIERVTRDAGLAFSGLGGYQRCDDHDGVERMLAATARLGAERVRVTMLPLGTAASGEGEPSGRSYPDLFDETREHVRWLADRAAAHGVLALIELHPRTVVSSASAAVRLLEDVDPAHIGVIHDSGNLVSEGGEDTLAGFQMLGPHLAHVHLKNARWRVVGEEGEGAVAGTKRWAPGPVPLREGQCDLLDYVRSLRRVGYDGWLTVEDFSTDEPLAARTAGNLAYLRAVLAAADAEG
jgi:sugar phosphate isomerase/epimerase